jgi:hypothetical protein
MVMSRKRIAERTERISLDAVSGKLETVTLDAVQRGLEAIQHAIDREMLKLGLSGLRYTLARRVIELATGHLPTTDEPEGT